MAKFKVLKKFRGIKEERLFEVGEEVELTKKRADEINKKLKNYGGGFIEEVKDKPKKKDKK